MILDNEQRQRLQARFALSRGQVAILAHLVEHVAATGAEISRVPGVGHFELSAKSSLKVQISKLRWKIGGVAIIGAIAIGGDEVERFYEIAHKAPKSKKANFRYALDVRGREHLILIAMGREPQAVAA